jgi:DNA modification methylase
MTGKILTGDSKEVLKTLEDNSIDSVVTDPPYGLKFMGKKWDYDVPSVELWKEVLRVLKPGGHILVACGTRTQHRMAVNIEDAGFEIRDVITWHYGSGFPKSLDISKAIDKQSGSAEFIQKPADGVGFMNAEGRGGYNVTKNRLIQTNEKSDEAKKYEGYGTALKPATEFWTLARKPIEGTVASNVLKYGSGGLNIDACRIGTEERFNPSSKNSDREKWRMNTSETDGRETIGRFPANVIFDEFTGKILDQMSGVTVSGSGNKSIGTKGNLFSGLGSQEKYFPGSEGGASRFFYCAKASQAERNAGCYWLDGKQIDESRKEGNPGGDNPRNRGVHNRKNHHPTVKPMELMQYLIKLITPIDGIVLDPFAGSGSTCIAGALLGFKYIGIEMNEEYVKIIQTRLKHELGMFL